MKSESFHFTFKSLRSCVVPAFSHAARFGEFRYVLLEWAVVTLQQVHTLRHDHFWRRWACRLPPVWRCCKQSRYSNPYSFISWGHTGPFSGKYIREWHFQVTGQVYIWLDTKSAKSVKRYLVRSRQRSWRAVRTASSRTPDAVELSGQPGAGTGTCCGFNSYFSGT